MSERELQHIEVGESEGIKILRFRESVLMEDRVIQDLGKELNSLVRENPGIKLVVNLRRIAQMGSAALGKLITLRRRVAEARGQLRFCELSQEASDIFRIAKLDDYFEICGSQQEAVQSLMGSAR